MILKWYYDYNRSWSIPTIQSGQSGAEYLFSYAQTFAQPATSNSSVDTFILEPVDAVETHIFCICINI